MTKTDKGIGSIVWSFKYGSPEHEYEKHCLTIFTSKVHYSRNRTKAYSMTVLLTQLLPKCVTERC